MNGDNFSAVGNVVDPFSSAATEDIVSQETFLRQQHCLGALGVDRAAWFLVRMGVVRRDRCSVLKVAAVDRGRHGIDGYADLQRLVSERGQIPVTEFVVPLSDYLTRAVIDPMLASKQSGTDFPVDFELDVERSEKLAQLG